MTAKSLQEFLTCESVDDQRDIQKRAGRIKEEIDDKNKFTVKHDCGTKMGGKVVLTLERAPFFYGRYIIEENGCVKLTKENAASYLNKEVVFRSVVRCDSANGYCGICIGTSTALFTSTAVEKGSGQEKSAIHVETCDSKEISNIYNNSEKCTFVPEMTESKIKELFPRYFQRDMRNFYEEFKYLTEAYSVVLEFEVMHWNEYVRLVMLSDKAKGESEVDDVGYHWIKYGLYKKERRRLKEALVSVLNKLHSEGVERA